MYMKRFALAVISAIIIGLVLLGTIIFHFENERVPQNSNLLDGQIECHVIAITEDEMILSVGDNYMTVNTFGDNSFEVGETVIMTVNECEIGKAVK